MNWMFANNHADEIRTLLPHGSTGLGHGTLDIQNLQFGRIY